MPSKEIETEKYQCEECGARIERISKRRVITDECPNCFENEWKSTLSTFWRGEVPDGL